MDHLEINWRAQSSLCVECWCLRFATPLVLVIYHKIKEKPSFLSLKNEKYISGGLKIFFIVGLVQEKVFLEKNLNNFLMIFFFLQRFFHLSSWCCLKIRWYVRFDHAVAYCVRQKHVIYLAGEIFYYLSFFNFLFLHCRSLLHSLSVFGWWCNFFKTKINMGSYFVTWGGWSPWIFFRIFLFLSFFYFQLHWIFFFYFF